MLKPKHGKDLLRFGFKKKPPKKDQGNNFLIRSKSILTGLHKLSSM